MGPEDLENLDSGFRRNDGYFETDFRSFAGMTLRTFARGSKYTK